MVWCFPLVTSLALLALTTLASAKDDVYQKPSAFLAEVFGGRIPKSGAIRLTGAHQGEIKRIMGHAYGSKRVRYWSDRRRTVWILEEIGKTKPITVGYVVAGGNIERVKVLIYRESHGWEVRQPFFTKQFRGARLASGTKLTKRIDNIAGATLSVRALTKMGKLALYLEGRRSGE